MKNAGAEQRPCRRDRVLLILGSVFICNPVVGLVDVIPDFVGAAMLYFGLTQCSFLNERVGRARRNSLWIVAISVFRAAASLMIGSGAASMNTLLAVTVFSAADATAFALFFYNLYAGFDEITLQNGFQTSRAKLPGAKFSAFALVIARVAANFLPELVAIADMDRQMPFFDGNAELAESLVSARPVIIFGLSAAALVFGIIFAVRQTGLLNAFYGEAGELINEKYLSEFGEHPEKRSLRAFAASVFVANAGAFFALDLSFDGKRVIPVAAMFGLLFLSSLIARTAYRSAGSAVWSAAACAAFAGAEIYRSSFVVQDPVVFYETPIKTAVISLAVSVAAAVIGLVCIRVRFAELAVYTGGPLREMRICWALWCAATAIWVAVFILPYMLTYLRVPQIVITAAFIYEFIKADLTVYGIRKTRNPDDPDDIRTFH